MFAPLLLLAIHSNILFLVKINGRLIHDHNHLFT